MWGLYLESFGAPFSSLKMNPGRKRKISNFDCNYLFHGNAHVLHHHLRDTCHFKTRSPNYILSGVHVRSDEQLIRHHKPAGPPVEFCMAICPNCTLAKSELFNV